MMRFLTSLIFSTMLLGCSSVGRIFNPTTSTHTSDIIKVVTPSESLTVLSAIGGLCLLAGMVLLVVSRGMMGWRPVIGGILLVVLNYAISAYADWIFIPAIIATGCISAAWGWKTIESILKKEYKK